MFCSTCGETLQTSFKFCPKCGKDLRNTLEQKPVEQKKDKDVSFKEFKAAKEKQRATFFRSKPDKKGKSAGGKREDMDQSVKINVGIMVHDSQGRELTVRRGKGLPVSVPKNCTAEMLLKAATDKHKAHSKDVIKPQFKVAEHSF